MFDEGACRAATVQTDEPVERGRVRQQRSELPTLTGERYGSVWRSVKPDLADCDALVEAGEEFFGIARTVSLSGVQPDGPSDAGMPNAAQCQPIAGQVCDGNYGCLIPRT